MRRYTLPFLVLILSLSPQRAAAQPARYRYIPLLYWPMAAEYRGVINYPDTAWSRELLGLTERGCPPYGRRERDASVDYWRNPELPEELDWAQASQGKRRIPCYRDHAGTDIAADPGAPVYAMADGSVVEIQNRDDAEGQNTEVEILHRREQRGEVYTWRSRYVHLRHDPPVAVGPIRAGQIVGYVSYRGTNTHLHVEVKDLFDDCQTPCITNPFGALVLWIDYDDDTLTDLAVEALPAPPPGRGLIENGAFAADLARWAAAPGAVWQVDRETLLLARAPYSAQWGAVEQSLPYFLAQDAPLEVRLRLSNPGGAPRYVRVSLRPIESWQAALGCTIVLAPGDSGAYALRGKLPAAWRGALLSIAVNPPDGQTGVAVDDVSAEVLTFWNPLQPSCQD